MSFKIGDKVTWTSQSGSYTTTKVGEVVAVVPAECKPDTCLPPKMHCGNKLGYGIRRNHETYLVKVKGKGNVAYWPRVCHLRLVDDEADRKAKKNAEAKDVARALLNFVNSIGNKNADVIDVIANDHRTLQQGVTRFCVDWLEKCAKMHDSNDFDMRNQVSCELGKEFLKIAPEKRMIPFI